jgi:hypothetical protein
MRHLPQNVAGVLALDRKDDHIVVIQVDLIDAPSNPEWHVVVAVRSTQEQPVLAECVEMGAGTCHPDDIAA